MKRIVALFLLVLLAASAWGQARPATIKVAVMAPLTGNLANIGEQFRQGVELKARQVNAAGGINGKKVELKYFDDKADPKEAANIAQLILGDRDIVAVIGSYTSSVCFAVTPILEKERLSMITPSASNPKLTEGNKVMFKMWTGFDVYAPMIADLAVTDLGKKRVAALYVYNDWGIGVKDYFVARVRKLGGAMVAEEVLYDGDKDFKTQLTRIKSRNPDVLAILTYYAEGAIIAQQAKALGLNIQLVGTGTFVEDQFLEMAKEYAEGMYVVNEFVSDDPRPSVKEFVKAFQAEFGGALPGNYQGNAYDALGAILHAYQHSGPTRVDINNGLHNLVGYKGMAGAITFQGQQIAKPQVFVQLNNGKWTFFKESPVIK